MASGKARRRRAALPQVRVHRARADARDVAPNLQQQARAAAARGPAAARRSPAPAPRPAGRSTRGAQRQGCVRGGQRRREHAEHVAGGEQTAGQDHDGPPPLALGHRRHQQHRLCDEAAARRQPHQRHPAEAEREHGHRQRPADAAESGDPVVPQRLGDQSGRHEHGGLRNRVRDELQHAAGPGDAAPKLRRSRRDRRGAEASGNRKNR